MFKYDPSSAKDSPLLKAVKADNIDLVKQQLLELKSPAEAVNKRDASGALPLHYATTNGAVAIAELLLKHMDRTMIDARDNNGNTALHGAYMNHSEGMINLLLINGANIDVVNNAGRNPQSYNNKTPSITLKQPDDYAYRHMKSYYGCIIS